jgi:hypothetical protein
MKVLKKVYPVGNIISSETSETLCISKVELGNGFASKKKIYLHLRLRIEFVHLLAYPELYRGSPVVIHVPREVSQIK